MGTKARKKSRGRRSAGARENKAAMLLITFIVCILFTVFFVQGFYLKEKIRSNDATKDELTSQIASESARTESIESLEQYMQSDEYIKQAAKDKLGLIENGEIVFKKAG